ncbi:hypothetical protein L5876_11210 [Hyphobacterium sp. SN044]|uniref:hypothetical protein n=1 Tax=Hyphobacterium sp. SN044 TaxID=2912575 RepID=UPI001F2DF5C5|nr:hypothetical protein [Hyphobacterium sp. SN044]MCF8880384.1 hypothetical protein [Hyphobacterium sp. SN044]
MKYWAMALGAAAIAAAPAAAQDIAQQPHYGSITLDSGFIPDPHEVVLQAGGTNDARALGGDCRGYVATAPDYNLYYSAGSFPLYFSATSERDTVLVINDPNGNWICDDDDGVGALNPGLEITRPASGLYNVWVGVYSGSGVYAPATLHISELGMGPNPSGGGSGSGGLDYSLPANYGEGSLRSGFLPDPQTVAISAGGNVSVREDVGGGCVGYASAAPDFELTYEAGSFDLFISAVSETDTTLIINDPNGNWVCNDDGAGFPNPGVHIENPSSGVYDIWVGTYSQSGGYPDATLYISELGFAGEFEDEGGTLDWSLPSNYGDVSLSGGFLPDPYTVELLAGGDTEVYGNVTGTGACRGYVTRSPDFELDFEPGSLDLYISAASASDTTLVVNGPDGRWYCDDDGGEGGFNPGILFENPEGGVYDIWVGTYSQRDPVRAILNISEIGFYDND